MNTRLPKVVYRLAAVVWNVVHVLAELMENAVAFFKPPTPVEVTASRVARGLAVEIEDRGIGMEPESRCLSASGR